MPNISKFFLYAYCLIHNIKKGVLIGSDISDHWPALFDETIRIKPKLILELGVRKGESTRVLAKAAKKNSSALVSVDINDCSNVTKYDNWFFVKMDDVMFAAQFKNWCKEKNLQPSVDVLFIDTSHTYEHTKKEINAWFPLLSKNAVVMFHDTNSKIIYKRLDGSLGVGNDYDRGVIKAVEEYYGTEFAETKNFEKKIKNNVVKHYNNCNGFLVIRKN